MTKPVFIHINKTARTSIVRAAGGQIVNAGHRTAANWVAEHGRPAVMFSVVRHPYDRVRSEYDYRRQRLRSGEANPHLANLDLSLDEWVVATFERDEFRTRPYFELHGVPFHEHNVVDDVVIWFRAQADWLTAADGSMVVDDVLRFDNLDADWAAWCERRGVVGVLPHENRSAGDRRSVADLGPRARRLIADHHHRDFDIFDYPT